MRLWLLKDVIYIHILYVQNKKELVSYNFQDFE